MSLAATIEETRLVCWFGLLPVCRQERSRWRGVRHRSTFPWHAMTRFQGGECGCTGQQFENATPGNCYHLPAGPLLVLHEGVCLMTAHTRLAFHEWIRLQLCHLIGVTGVACA